MYYSSPLHKGALINYEDMRISKYRGETKYGSFVLICGHNPVPPPTAPPTLTYTHTPSVLKSIFCRLIWSGCGEMAGWKEIGGVGGGGGGGERSV